MNLRDARTIPPEQLFERRKQAVALFKKGMTRGGIGNIVGVRRDVVGQWISKWQAGGLQALKVVPFGSVHASEHFFKLENELFGFRIGSSLAYVAVD